VILSAYIELIAQGDSVESWTNWVLVIGGLVCVTAELLMGAATGFDLALVGASLSIGGAIGLAMHSPIVGLVAAGVLALLYLAVLRSWLKSKLSIKHQKTNADAVIGRTGVVTKRIAGRDAGMIKLGDETWRAELASFDDAAREAGATVTVQSVEGVTVKVR
jgi:membrane protein implicated in regulation of membrane protease activity